jgi:hypothetical protein
MTLRSEAPVAVAASMSIWAWTTEVQSDFSAIDIADGWGRSASPCRHSVISVEHDLPAE